MAIDGLRLFVIFVCVFAPSSVDSVQLSVYFSSDLPHRVDFSNDTGAWIRCAADGSPAPRLRWTTSDGAPLVDVPGLRWDLGNGTLHFSPFRAEEYREDVHALAYVCVASNHRGTVVSHRVRVRAVVKQHYEVQVYDEFVIRGNVGLLRCNIPSFVEEYLEVVAWLSDRGQTFSRLENADRFVVVSTGDLYVADVRPSDGDEKFRCKTRNRLTGETKLSSAGRIVITETQSSMPPRMTYSKASVEARQADRVELICTSQGFPVPTYSWYRVADPRPVPVGNEGRLRQWKSLLVVTHAQPSDSGRYRCEATNGVGSDAADRTLSVKAPLTIQVTPKLQTVDVGKAAAMTCIANGHPPTTPLVWFKNGRPLVTDDRVGFTAGKILTITGARREDQGIYQCFVVENDDSAYGAAELKLGRVLPVITSHFSGQAVLPGTDVSLRCVASGNPSPSITWTVDDRPASFRRSDSFVATDGDVTSFLNVTSVKMEDGGEYRCRAENGIGVASHAAPLDVIGPPFVKEMRNVSVVAGTVATLHCRVAGYPIASVVWKKGDAILPVDPRQQVHRNGTLSISAVDHAFDQGLYTCTASNDRGERASGSAALSVVVPPQIAPLSFPPKLHVGTRARLQCVVTEGDLPIGFLWLKDGKPIADDLQLLAQQGDEFSSTLTFPSIRTHHNGNYTCVARNAAATANYSTTLVVEVPPFWVFQPIDTSVAYGKSVLLSCTADGFPKPHILWKKAYGNHTENFQDLYYSSDKYKMFSNGSLLIESASELDEGHYLCHAKNGIGPGLNKVAYLLVEAAVRFDVKFQNLTAKKGETASLGCHVRGDPPIRTSWKLKGLKIDANVDYRYVIKEHTKLDEVKSVLEIHKVDIRDSGSYSCAAFNVYGKDETVIQLNVRDNPDPPENLKIVQHQSRTVHLSWAPPFDGGSPIRKYFVQFKNGSEDWKVHHLNITVQHPDTAAVVENLRPGTAYSFRVIAVNEVGFGKPSNGVGIRTTEEAPTGFPTGVEARADSSQTVLVTWKPPPKEDRNGEIVGYHVGHRPHGSAEPFKFKNVEANASKTQGVLLSGLAKFTKFSVVVRAFNRIGAGPASEEVFVTTREDVPNEPPDNIRCSSMSPESFEISWDPPPKSAQNGLLQSYRLVYQPILRIVGKEKAVSYARRSESQERTFSSTVLTTSLHGLLKYTNYSIRLLASTRVGDGVFSEPVYCRTHEDVPSAPAGIKAITMSSNIILVTWKPPVDPNGEIVSYSVYVRRADSGRDTTKQATKHTMSVANGLRYEARGLKEGERYEFWVTSSTTIGEGSSTAVVAQTAQYKAGAGIAAFSDRILAYWQSNVSLPCPVIGMPSPKTSWSLNSQKSNERMVQTEEGTLVILRVQRQDAGNYTCTAKNIYGTDQVVYELVVLAPPQPPFLSLSKVTASAIVLFVRSMADGGIPIKGYVLSYREFQGKWNELRVDASEEKIVLKDLRCGTLHQIYVTAHNEVGIGEPSTILPINTRGTVPVVPQLDDILQPNVTSITVRLFRWPANECVVHRFSLQYRRKARSSWIPVLDNVGPIQKEIVITHLESGTPYEVKVTAHNNAGTAVASYEVTTMIYVKGLHGIRIVSASYATPSPFYEDMSIVIPAASSTIATIAMIVGICICVRRNRRPGVFDPEKIRHSDVQLASGLGSHSIKCDADQRVASTGNCQFHLHSLKSPIREDDDDPCMTVEDEIICPYATSHVLPFRVESPTRRKFENAVLISRASMDAPKCHDLRNLSLDSQKTLSKRQLHCRQQQYTEEDRNARNGCFPVRNESRKSYLIEKYDECGEDGGLDVRTAITASNHTDFVKNQNWDTLSKCLHRYPDLLYHGPESETSDETDFDEINFAMSLDGNVHSGNSPEDPYSDDPN